MAADAPRSILKDAFRSPWDPADVAAVTDACADPRSALGAPSHDADAAVRAQLHWSRCEFREPLGEAWRGLPLRVVGRVADPAMFHVDDPAYAAACRTYTLVTESCIVADEDGDIVGVFVTEKALPCLAQMCDRGRAALAEARRNIAPRKSFGRSCRSIGDLPHADRNAAMISGNLYNDGLMTWAHMGESTTRYLPRNPDTPAEDLRTFAQPFVDLFACERAIVPDVARRRLKLAEACSLPGAFRGMPLDAMPATMVGVSENFSVKVHRDSCKVGITETIFWANRGIHARFAITSCELAFDIGTKPCILFMKGNEPHGTVPGAAGSCGLVLISKQNTLGSFHRGSANDHTEVHAMFPSAPKKKKKPVRAAAVEQQVASAADEAVNPRQRFNSVAAWVAADAAWQCSVFHASGKRPHLTPPPLATFPTAAMHAQALLDRKFVCDKPAHAGNRVLGPSEINRKGGRTCKACKAADAKERKERVREAPTIYETAEAFLAATAKAGSDTHPDMTVGFCAAPKPAQFSTAQEFDRAVALRNDHIKRYQRALRQVPAFKDRVNEGARVRYRDSKAMAPHPTRRGVALRRDCIHAVCISQQHEDRRRIVEKTLCSHFPDLVVFDAINADAPSDIPNSVLSRMRVLPTARPGIKERKAASWASHTAVLQNAVDTMSFPLLVLEDDICIPAQLSVAFDSLPRSSITFLAGVFQAVKVKDMRAFQKNQKAAEIAATMSAGLNGLDKTRFRISRSAAYFVPTADVARALLRELHAKRTLTCFDINLFTSPLVQHLWFPSPFSSNYSALDSAIVFNAKYNPA